MEIILLIMLLFLFGVGLAFAVYFHYRAKYRNADARYKFEHTTDATLANLAYADDYVGEVRGVKQVSIVGRNDHTPTVRAAYVKVHGMDVDHADPPPAVDPGVSPT